MARTSRAELHELKTKAKDLINAHLRTYLFHPSHSDMQLLILCHAYRVPQATSQMVPSIRCLMGDMKIFLSIGLESFWRAGLLREDPARRRPWGQGPS